MESSFREDSISSLCRYLNCPQHQPIKENLAWSANLTKRLVKSPKVHLVDTGLSADLIGLQSRGTGPVSALRGGLTESFVAMELEKQLSWSDVRASIHHFRTARGEEVDLVLEAAGGALVGIEVKLAGAVSSSDFKGLRTLQSLRPNDFHRGVVLYAGDQVVHFGPQLHAVPFSALWRW